MPKTRHPAGVRTFCLRRPRLVVEPDVFEAPAVKDAVDHHSQTLDPRLPARGEPQMVSTTIGPSRQTKLSLISLW